MTDQLLISGSSTGMKLIRFFKLIGFLGGIIWGGRFLIVVAIVVGVIFLMR